MKGSLKVKTPEEYIAKLDEPRKSDVAALDELVRKSTKLEPEICMGILVYGPFHYKYKSGREGDWFRIGIASNKAYISLYVNGSGKDGYIAEQYREALPKANIGKCCVRFKRLSDLHIPTVRKMLKDSLKLALPEM